jgi:RNA polymerase sigma-70 factor (ECF subfamily)
MRDRTLSAFVAQALREADRRPHVGPPPLAAGAPAVQPGVNEVAVAAAGGDVEAIGRLYDALVDPIYRYVAIRVTRREDAEDLTQVVFERIVSSLPRYRDRGRPFEAWAFRIARNAVIDHVRRERPHEPLDEGQHVAPTSASPESLSLRGEELRELRRAIGALTADQQEAIALRFAAGLSASEAAQVMGREAGTIRGLTFRAIASLRRHLGGDRGSEIDRS